MCVCVLPTKVPSFIFHINVFRSLFSHLSHSEGHFSYSDFNRQSESCGLGGIGNTFIITWNSHSTSSLSQVLPPIYFSPKLLYSPNWNLFSFGLKSLWPLSEYHVLNVQRLQDYVYTVFSITVWRLIAVIHRLPIVLNMLSNSASGNIFLNPLHKSFSYVLVPPLQKSKISRSYSSVILKCVQNKEKKNTQTF